MGWIPIDALKDDDKIASGVAFKLLPTSKGIRFGNYIPEKGLIYILVDLPEDHMCLSCISEGEQGNTMSYLKKHVGSTYVLGKEVKKILLDDIQFVLINMKPRYFVE